MSPNVEHTVWQQDGVDPAAVEGAMRTLERERFQRARGALPARALNLVAIVDADYAGEVSRRLESIGRNTPSRTILVRVAPRRSTLSARVTLTGDSDPASRDALSELVVLDVAERHLPRLESIVDVMVMTDVPTIVWAPHGHVDALRSIGELAQTVMLDTADGAEASAGFDDAWDLIEHRGIAVVDLSWLRATPWRQRLAAHYQGAARAGELDEIVAVEIRHERRSVAAAWLLLGWLGDRLGWRSADGRVLDASGRPVRLHLSPVVDTPPGLAGATVSSRSGSTFSLDRNPGGLRACRTDVVRGSGDATTTTERHWTVMGASRGEAGVLATALRRTLVPDDGYRGALATARRLTTCT
ncbi:glucose-6-phosphate dehydrogenase assembly protein OpcA [Patulibacter sp. S7RM1-6]